MKTITDGTFDMSNKYNKFDPRYWLLESPGRWLLYIFIFQVFVFYTMSSVLSLLHPDTVAFLKEFSISILNSNDKYLVPMRELTAAVVLSGLVFWLLIPLEVIAVYYMLSRSGRDLAFPSLFNDEVPDMRGLIIEEMFMDRRKYSGKTKVISLKRRVFSVSAGLLIGLTFFFTILFIPEVMFVLNGTNTTPAFQNYFLNMFFISLGVGINLNLVIIPARDVFINVKNRFL